MTSDYLLKRRHEQLSRIPGFLFMAPPTDPKFGLRYASMKTRTFTSAKADGPTLVTNRADMDALRKKHNTRVEYMPHQGARERAR